VRQMFHRSSIENPVTDGTFTGFWANNVE